MTNVVFKARSSWSSWHIKT